MDNRLILILYIVTIGQAALVYQPDENSLRAMQRRQKRENEPEKLDCDFGTATNLEICGWVATNMSIMQWKLGSEETAFLLGGPNKDHTTSGDTGYIVVETSINSPSAYAKQTAILESPLQESTMPQGTCLQFWYKIKGLSADTLRLLLIPEDETTPLGMGNTILWEAKDSELPPPSADEKDEGSGWALAEVLYTSSYKHKLIFEGQSKLPSDPGSMYRGYIAIDDIEAKVHGVNHRACKGFCAFEGKMCEWTNDETGSDFQWEQGRSSSKYSTGPSRDHGSQMHGGNTGGFVFIDASNPKRRPGDKARLISPAMAPTTKNPLCLRFYTHMFGSGIGSLRVLLTIQGKETLIWMVSGDAGNQWHMGQTTLSAPEIFQVIFEATVGKNSLGNIALDDITFRPGPCPGTPQTAVLRQADCTFENDECNWINVNAPGQDQADWQRISPQQMTSGPPPNLPVVVRRLEPAVDHTRGLPDGFYLQMERGSVPARNGDRAMFISPIFKPTKSACLSFWVALHERSVDSSGPGLGTIRVYVRPVTATVMGPVGIPVWRLGNYEAPGWFHAQVPVRNDEPFKIVIEGTWGFSRQGSMAIDDLTIYDDVNCKVKPAVASVFEGECTFERGYCGWTTIQTNVTSAQNQWQIATPLRRPSNINDHTYLIPVGYAFFDMYSPQTAITSRLESPDLKSEEGAVERCLSFWFLPLGSASESQLKVIEGPSQDGKLQEDDARSIWRLKISDLSIPFNSQPDWIYAQTTINMGSNPSKVAFEGTSTNGGFAVDDVNFTDGECPLRPLKAKKGDDEPKVRSEEITTERIVPTKRATTPTIPPTLPTIPMPSSTQSYESTYFESSEANTMSEEVTGAGTRTGTEEY